MKSNVVRRLLSYVFVLFSFLTVIQTQAQNRNSRALADFNQSILELSAKVSQSVVQIIGTGYGLETDGEHHGASVLSTQRSTGSGVIVSDDGYIMTNAHVVAGAQNIRVKLNKNRDGSPSLLDAQLIGTDNVLDLALLKIQATGLMSLPFGNSLGVKQGEIVLAFGSPRGMDNSVTMGVVSSPSRQLTEDDPRVFIQTDAPINPGNSGGPLVDIEGRVIGMNTFILSESGGSEGIGFAIPSNVIRYAFASIKKEGHVHRGQIGMSARTITAPLALAFNLEQENGVLVEDVVPDGPADKAGLQIGDVVLSFGGAPLRNVRDLYLQLFQYGRGDNVELLLLRNRGKVPVTVAVTEKKSDPQRFVDLVTPEKNLIARLAILGLNVNSDIAQNLSLRSAEGVLVVALVGTSRYFGDQPREGDVIRAVNSTNVSSIETLRAALDSMKSGQPIVLQAERGGSLMFLVLESD